MAATAARHALELTGAGLRLAGPAGMLAAEPAWASFESGPVVTGRAARGRSRLAPLFTSNRHLEAPDTVALPRPGPAARSNADLVYAQLATLAPLLAGEPVVVAGSSAYTLEQLALLAGVAAAAGVAVRGVVDAAVAACADQPATARALYLDLEMNRAVLTEMNRSEGLLRRGRVDVLRGAGIRSLEDAAARCIAQSFVRATRFDPLHQAASEQVLYDRLPGWIGAAAAGEMRATIEHGGLRHETVVRGVELDAALKPQAAELVRLLQSVRRAGERLTIFASAQVAGWPALVAALGALDDGMLVALPVGAAAAGAAAHAAELGDCEPQLLTALAAAPPVLPPAAGSLVPAPAPTHVVYQGRAYPLGPEPLTIGRSTTGLRAIALGGNLAGVSRAHCRLTLGGGDAVLEDLSSYGTFINGERVERRARLATGDRVRVGTPGIEFELVRIEG